MSVCIILEFAIGAGTAALLLECSPHLQTLTSVLVSPHSLDLLTGRSLLGPTHLLPSPGVCLIGITRLECGQGTAAEACYF